MPYVPSPVRVRSYQFVRTLLRRGNHITLAAPVECADDLRAAAVLRSLGAAVVTLPLHPARKAWNCASALIGGDPLQAAFSWQPQLMHTASDLMRLGKFDAVHVEHLRGVRYMRAARVHLPDGVPLVWDAVDSISHLFQQTMTHGASHTWRSIAHFELARTRRCERRALHEATHAVVTSQIDRAALAENAGSGAAPIVVIPNGVDLRVFRPAPDAAYERHTIVFSGRMSYHANVAAALRLAQRILPRVRAAQPEARLVIVGRDPPHIVRALADESNGVTVTGAVHDLAEYVRRADVAAAPLVYGAGVQNKVLEAMACGTPVVADPLATRALDPSCADALLVAAEDDDFAEQILRLFEDRSLRQRLAESGRAFVEKFHSWDGAAAQLEELYRCVA